MKKYYRVVVYYEVDDSDWDAYTGKHLDIIKNDLNCINNYHEKNGRSTTLIIREIKKSSQVMFERAKMLENK